MSLYSIGIREYLGSRPWPKGLVFDIVEYEMHLGFRLYRDNFNAFDAADRLQIAGQVKEVMEKIRNDGIPIYMEVEKNVPAQ